MDIVVVPIMAALEGISSALSSIGIPYSFGFAIIVFTLLIKLVTAPLNAKQIKSSKAMQEMQPKLQELQKKYKDNKEELAKRQMEMYKEAGVNPMGGCLPSLVQFPIWIGLYQALYRLAQSGKLAEGFFWVPSLAEPTGTGWLLQSPANWDLPYVGAYLVLPVLTVVTQLLMQKMMTPKNADPQTSTMNQMMMLMPFMFGFFAIQVPSGLSLYWVTMNIFSGIQQYLMTGWGGLAPKKSVAGTTVAGKKDTPQPKESLAVKTKASPVPNPPAASAKKGQATRARKRKR
jgi:YidC/Oxa1 family membrane protein insertase